VKPRFGPSPADSAIAAEGFPGFIIDADSIYFTDGITTHTSWPRVINGCSVLPPTSLDRRPGNSRLFPATGNNAKRTTRRSTWRGQP
jgi:hypothetical protein